MANRPQGFEDCVKNTKQVEFHGILWVKSLSSPPATDRPVQYWAVLGPIYGWRATQISILSEQFDLLQVGTVVPHWAWLGGVLLGRFRFSQGPNASNQFKSRASIATKRLSDSWRRWDHSGRTTPTVWHTTKGGKHIASVAETVEKDSKSFCICLQTYAKWGVDHFGPDPSRIAKSNFCLRISKLLYLALRCFSQCCMWNYWNCPTSGLSLVFLVKPEALNWGWNAGIPHASQDCFRAETVVLACQPVHFTEKAQVKDLPGSKTTERSKKIQKTALEQPVCFRT